jgi:hypothetical protein
MSAISPSARSYNQRTGAAANSRFSKEAPSQIVTANIRLDAVHPISDLVDRDKMATKYGGLEFRFCITAPVHRRCSAEKPTFVEPLYPLEDL